MFEIIHMLSFFQVLQDSNCQMGVILTKFEVLIQTEKELRNQNRTKKNQQELLRTKGNSIFLVLTN